jgi:hypothetical protein
MTGVLIEVIVTSRARPRPVSAAPATGGCRGCAALGPCPGCGGCECDCSCWSEDTWDACTVQVAASPRR